MILSILFKKWWYNYYTSLILINYQLNKTQNKYNSLSKEYYFTLLWLSYKQLDLEVYDWYNKLGTKYDKIMFNHYVRACRRLSISDKPEIYQIPREYIGLVNSL